MATRKIIKIDEEKCNGCGLCASACAEGALKIIDGKARLVSETYCDGLGACLGECPQDAITIEDREAAQFDAKAVEANLGHAPLNAAGASQAHATAQSKAGGFVCPGMASQSLREKSPALKSVATNSAAPMESGLGNWPVQLNLVPTSAPYYQEAKLVIAADCAPFAYADFHRRFLGNSTLLIGCPKLDDAAHYRAKLTEIFSRNAIAAIEVVYMEVPCCFGLVQTVRQALAASSKEIPLTLTKIGIRGRELESVEV